MTTFPSWQAQNLALIQCPMLVKKNRFRAVIILLLSPVTQMSIVTNIYAKKIARSCWHVDIAAGTPVVPLEYPTIRKLTTEPAHKIAVDNSLLVLMPAMSNAMDKTHALHVLHLVM